MGALRSTRLWISIAAVVAVVALAVGCGADDDVEDAIPPAADDATEAPDPAEPVAEPEPAPQPDPEPGPLTADGQAELVWSQTFEEKVQSLEVTPDGDYILAGTDATYVVQTADGVMVDAIVYWYPSVDDLGVSPDGSIIGAGVAFGGVQLTGLDGSDPEGMEDFDRQNPEFAGVRHHGGYDNRLAFSPDGEHLASGNRDGEVWIWSLSDGSQVSTLAAPDAEYLTRVTYHPSGTLLAATHFDCVVNLWNVDSQQLVDSLELDHSSCYLEDVVEFSPDGELIAAAVTEDWAQLLRIWTVDGLEQVIDVDMDVRNFAGLSFSPDSTMLATAAWLMPATVWDVATGAPLYSLDTGIDPDAGDGWYHPTRIQFTPDGGHVIAGYYDGTLELWRLPGVAELVPPQREACEPLPLPGDVLFDTGSAKLKAEADEVLTDLAEHLRDGFDQAALTFVGHTDSRGDAASNRQLSLERASSVGGWFEAWTANNGVEGWSFEVDGRGDTDLKVLDTTEDGQFLSEAGGLNRRVEIEIGADVCGP